MKSAMTALLALLLPFVAGCPRSRSLPPLAPVRGKVLYLNKPLPRARFLLEPDRGHKKGLVAEATTREDGSFSVSTYLDRVGLREGAVPGKYRLVFEAYPGAEQVVPERYRSFEHTPFRVDVPAIGRDNLTLNVVD